MPNDLDCLSMQDTYSSVMCNREMGAEGGGGELDSSRARGVLMLVKNGTETTAESRSVERDLNLLMLMPPGLHGLTGARPSHLMPALIRQNAVPRA